MSDEILEVWEWEIKAKMPKHLLTVIDILVLLSQWIGDSFSHYLPKCYGLND